MATHALKAASEALAKNKVSHICFTLDGSTGVFKVIGDNVTVAAFESDEELKETIKKKLEEAIREGGEQSESVSRTKLFARPGTAEWKGAARIREACGHVLADLGYGKNKTLIYGKGEAPTNWPVLYPWSSFRGPSKHSTEMCTQIVSSLTNFEEVEEEELEEAEEGELQEAEEGGGSEENEENLVLELSTDLEEEEQSSRKKKPTIVDNTRKKGEGRKRLRKPSVTFMDTVEDEVEDEVHAKRSRFDSRPLSKYEQLREIRIAERKQMEDEIFGEV